MKKINILAAAMICSLIGGMTLVSCGETTSTGTPTTETPTTIQESAKRIIVTVPEEDVLVGDVLNLDDYVEVVGLSDENNFTATVKTTDLAELNGHELTIIGEGEVKVEIVAGSKKANFIVDSLSVLRAAFKEKTKFTTQYFVEDLTFDNDGNVIRLGEGIIHNNNYFAYPEYDKYDNLSQYSGILKAKSGKTYNYSMKNRNGDSLEVEAGPQSDFNLYYLAMGNSLSYTDFETVYDEDGNPVGLTTTDETAIQNYCMQSCGVYDPVSYGQKTGTTFTQELMVDFIAMDEEGTLENSKLAIMVIGYDHTNKTNGEPTPYLFTFGLIHSDDPAMYNVAGLDNYINSGNEPVALECTEIEDIFSEMAAAKNYTQVTEYFFSSAGGVTAEGDGTQPLGLPVTEVTQVVDATTVLNQEQVGEDVVTSFYKEKDGQVYAGDNYERDASGDVVLDANENPVVGSSFTVSPMEGYTSIWDDEVLGGLTVAQIADPDLFARVEVVQNVEIQPGYKLIQLSSAELAAALIFSAAGYGPSMANVYTQNGFYDYTYIQAIVGEGYLCIDVFLGLNLGNGQVTYYHVRSTYGAIGTTQVPDVSSLL